MFDIQVSRNAILVSLAATILYTFRQKWKKPISHPLPPGPPSYPLIGQLLSMPLSSEHTTFDKQSREIQSSCRILFITMRLLLITSMLALR